MKAKHLFIIILACVLASCAGAKKGPFSAWERTLIERSDSVMYVFVVDDRADSLELRDACRELSDEELQSDLYAVLAATSEAQAPKPAPSAPAGAPTVASGFLSGYKA